MQIAAEEAVGLRGQAPIGFVTAIEGKGSPSFSVVHFRLRPGVPVPAPGTMVAIAPSDAAANWVTVARVDDGFEINPHEDPASSKLREVLPIGTMYAAEADSTVIMRLAVGEPLQEAVVDDNGNVMRVSEAAHLVRAGSEVYEAWPELTGATLGTLTDPQDGLHIGTLKGAPDTPIVLKKEVIQRHIFIGGGIGSGKSYTRGVLAEELHAWDIPQINIDVNGEMTEATDELGGRNLRPGQGFTLPLSAFTSGDVLNAAPSLNGNMRDLVAHAFEELLAESRRNNTHFLVDDLVAKIEEVAVHLEMKSVTMKPAQGRVRSLNRIRYIGQPFDWAAALTPGAIINIDCRDQSVRDLRIIVAAVARDIQRLARAQKIPFVVLSIDEFHLVAPKDDETVALQVLRELARVGRHLRIGLILTTQSPQDVDRSVLKRLLTRLLHAIEPDQLEALRGVFSDASDKLVHQLPKMPQGTCVLTGAFETVRHATVIDVRTRHTTHGGATPDIFGDRVKRPQSTKAQ